MMNNIEDDKFWRMGESIQTRSKWCQITDFLSNDEIDNIIKNNNEAFQPSRMEVLRPDGGFLNTSQKKSKMVQLPFFEYGTLYSRIEDAINYVNHKNFKFVLTKIQKLNFLRYDVGDHMALHTDSPFDTASKLSMIISLSEEDVDYTGGKFHLYDGNRPVTENNGIHHIKMKKGSIMFYPAYYLHTVEPVLTGTRYSIVTWIYGDSPFS